jgi:hypothetical protein
LCDDPLVLAPLLALALAAAAQDAAANTALPVSLDRIREGLQRKPALRISAPPPEPPTYRVEIIQHPFFRAEPKPWDYNGGGFSSSAPSATAGAPSPGARPQGGTDILPLFTKAKRALDEHAAIREVQQAIADFCAHYSCVLR